MRKMAIAIWLIILFSVIAFLFWKNELQYSLPTPVPENYKAISTGENIVLPAALATGNKPVFLHFFNPECPCSKFNIPHVKSLVKAYSKDISFAIVVQSETEYSEKEIQNRFNLNVPVLFDTTLAKTCGVYSTPQAVIIDTDHKLYYRGNYNKTRYCTDKKTEYAKMALDSLMQQHYTVSFGADATKAYGCELPKCSKK